VICMVISLVLLGCYNIRTGETTIGGDISFTLPAFPETGSNAVQVFTEMHYQPSYRVQERPRLLPPSESVPVTGKEIWPTTTEEYRALAIPTSAKLSYNKAKAQALYDINCSVCHGVDRRGDGPLTTMTRDDNVTLVLNKGPYPADLTSEATMQSTDGELFAFISRGGRQGFSSALRSSASSSPMPEFMRLLVEEERWWLVEFLRGR